MVDRAAAAKFAVLEQIYGLAQEQREALDDDDLERFGRILDEREALIERLSEIAVDGGDSLEMPANVVAFPRPSDSAGEDELALDAVIRGILERDEQNETLLGAKMDEIRQELPALAAGHRAAAGYRVDPHRSAFIDRTS